jgi:hypothetical protein
MSASNWHVIAGVLNSAATSIALAAIKARDPADTRATDRCFVRDSADERKARQRQIGSAASDSVVHGHRAGNRSITRDRDFIHASFWRCGNIISRGDGDRPGNASLQPEKPLNSARSIIVSTFRTCRPRSRGQPTAA